MIYTKIIQGGKIPMDNTKGCINVVLDDFQNAPNGAVLVKDNGKWVATTQMDLFKKINDRLNELEKLRNEFEPLKKANALLNDNHAKDTKLLDLLMKLVAYLVYERRVDNGELKESANDKSLIKKLLTNDYTDLPIELEAFMRELTNIVLEVRADD